MRLLFRKPSLLVGMQGHAAGANLHTVKYSLQPRLVKMGSGHLAPGSDETWFALPSLRLLTLATRET